MDTIYVFVGMFGGLVDTVVAYKDEEDAKIAWFNYTGVTWKEYEESNYDDSLLKDKYGGSIIHATELRGQAGCA